MIHPSSSPARTYIGSIDTRQVATHIEGKTVLVTGGTGSFGHKFVDIALRYSNPKKVIVLSRDEMKQSEMAERFPDPRLRFWLGDVRDRNRLHRAFQGVDVIIHAAALKVVPSGEYNPFEVVKTNVIGAENVIDIAIDSGVSQVVALSSDKAANPINLYGASKLCADKLFIGGNSYAANSATRFSIVRYGNVLNSRGSVVPFFLERRTTGVLPITHPEMTRFWITLEQAVALVLAALGWMHGGEIFVPKIPSMKVVDVARAVAPECRHEIVGIRPGEKMHEILIPSDEARNTFAYNTHFVIAPAFRDWKVFDFESNGGCSVIDGFQYSSDTNDHWLTIDELIEIAELPVQSKRGTRPKLPHRSPVRKLAAASRRL